MTSTIRRRIEEVAEGIRYKGTIRIGGVKFDYELKFSTPIPDLDSTKQPGTVEQVRLIFQISLERDGRKIELDEDEYSFFFSMLVEAVVKFYNSLSRHGEGSTAIVQIATCHFSPDACQMLSSEKFGCTFTNNSTAVSA